MYQIWTALIQQGIAGLILGIIILPLIKWLVGIIHKQREDFTLIIRDYFIHRKHDDQE